MKIYIGTPTRDQIFGATAMSIMMLRDKLEELGHDLIIDFPISNNIPYIRNLMAMKSLEMGADALLFIDSDVSFNPGPIIKLIESEYDFCALPYRLKRSNEHYLCTIESDENMRPITDGKGWIKLQSVATGLTKYSRKCLEMMVEAHRDREYLYTAVDNDPPMRIVSVFEYQIIDKTLWGEDYTFCRRWRDLGGDIWLWPDATTQHWGVCAYSGNMSHYLTIEALKEQAQGKDNLNQFTYKSPPEIEGWLTDLEASWLHHLASRVDSFIEVGCWKGKGTHAICSGCNGQVYAVDHFNGTDGEHEVSGNEVFDAFVKNTKQFSNLNILRMASECGAKEIDSADVVFIDADHSYESVKKDIAMWTPKAKKIICGHDYSEAWPGVKQAVDEAFGTRVSVFENIWMVVKD